TGIRVRVCAPRQIWLHPGRHRITGHVQPGFKTDIELAELIFTGQSLQLIRRRILRDHDTVLRQLSPKPPVIIFQYGAGVRLDESLNISGHDPHPLYRPLSRRPSTPAVAWQISRPPLPYSATNPGHTDAPPETSPASEYNPRPARM